MLWRGILLCVLILLGCFLTPAAAEDSRVFTLWPLLDDRASSPLDYHSFHLLGPLFKYETKGEETEYALRPFVYRAVDDTGSSQTEVLYPFLTYRRSESYRHLDILHLLSYDFGQRESGSANKSYLFPFLFYGESREKGRYMAFFPLGGTLYDWFGRDEITFTLFPLYSRTQRKTTRIDNVLWPIFARVSGEDESGWKFWPFYGRSQKEGIYRKRFYLWPIGFNESLALDTDNPVHKRAVLPFWLDVSSPQYSQNAVLWPFFTWKTDRGRHYREWNMPWPLVRVTKGETRNGLRLLPFYSDETVEANRKRWYLWPIYKIENTKTDMFERRRDRVLFFLYSDLHERKFETGADKRRISLWPLFTYSREEGVSHLRLISLLEPLFPGNQAIRRSWSPLWHLYQQKWDRQGNSVVSLLWNLYWHERQGDQVMMELFPLFAYKKQSSSASSFELLKGLFRLESSVDGKAVYLFYLPWGVSFGGESPQHQVTE